MDATSSRRFWLVSCLAREPSRASSNFISSRAELSLPPGSLWKRAEPTVHPSRNEPGSNRLSSAHFNPWYDAREGEEKRGNGGSVAVVGIVGCPVRRVFFIKGVLIPPISISETSYSTIYSAQLQYHLPYLSYSSIYGKKGHYWIFTDIEPGKKNAIKWKF